MTRRTTLARVLTATLAATTACAGLALMSGCQNNRGGSRTTDAGVEYTVVVDNNSKYAVGVDWSVALRRIDTGDVGQATGRSLGVVAPRDTARDAMTFLNVHKSTEYVHVFRLKLTIPSASWQEAAVMWWEVVSDLPERFVIERGPGPDGFLVRLRADGASIEAVPRQFWSEPVEGGKVAAPEPDAPAADR